MWQLVAGLVFAGVVSAVAWSSWSAFKDGIAAPYVEAQKKADQAVVDAAEARAKRAEANAEAAAAASAAQSQAIQQAAQEAAQAQRRTEEVLDAYGKLVRSTEARIQGLRDLAAAAPKDGRSCEQVLGEVGRILRDSARVRNSTSGSR